MNGATEEDKNKFMCCGEEFIVTHKTLLHEFAESTGRYDVECREIPDVFINGVRMYAGRRDLMMGRDMLDLLDFLLFAEINVLEIISADQIVKFLKHETDWYCSSGTTAYFICKLFGKYSAFELVQKGLINPNAIDAIPGEINIDPETNLRIFDRNPDIITVGSSLLAQFENLSEISIDSCKLSHLRELHPNNLRSLGCKQLLVDAEANISEGFAVFSNLEIMNVKFITVSSVGAGASVVISIRLPKLEGLNVELHSSSMRGLGRIDIDGDYPALKSLNIGDNGGGSFIDFTAPSMKILEYRNEYIGSLLIDTIYLPGVTEVKFDYPAIFFARSDAMDVINTVMPNVTSLTLGSLTMNNYDIKLAELPKLQSFKLIWNTPDGNTSESYTGKFNKYLDTHNASFAYSKEIVRINIDASWSMPMHSQGSALSITIASTTTTCPYAVTILSSAGRVGTADIYYPTVRDWSFIDGIKELTLRGVTSGLGRTITPMMLESLESLICYKINSEMIALSTIYNLNDMDHDVQKYMRRLVYDSDFLIKEQVIAKRAIHPVGHEPVSVTTSIWPQCMFKYYETNLERRITDYRTITSYALKMISAYDAIEKLVANKHEMKTNYKYPNSKPTTAPDTYANKKWLSRATDIGNCMVTRSLGIVAGDFVRVISMEADFAIVNDFILKFITTAIDATTAYSFEVNSLIELGLKYDVNIDASPIKYSSVPPFGSFK